MATGLRPHREVQLDKLYYLKPLLLRALNNNQILILSEIGGSCITTVLKNLSARSGIPLSTLKLNAKVLKKLGLIRYDEFYEARLTETGSMALGIINSNYR